MRERDHKAGRGTGWGWLPVAASALAALVACGPGSPAGERTAAAGEAAPAGETAATGKEAAAGEAGAADPARNLLLITVDTLRADALGFAGNEQVETPALDRLAAAGRVYPDAHAHSVMTLPSHTSLLTGLLPYQHGVRHNGGFVLGPEPPTLAGLLQQAGFATAAVVGAYPLDSHYGLDRGFDLYDDAYDVGPRDQIFTYSQRPGSEVVERAQRWWEERRGERRFLWVHLFDPHAPYEPPGPLAGRYAGRPYLGEVAAVDGYLAPLLAGFLDGSEEPTVIAFTADHGEALGDHGELTHGLFAYEPTLHVPLVLWGPGIAPGTDPRPAGHVDLLPTLLALLGLQPPPDLPGVSLLAQPPSPRPGGLYFEALAANLDYGWAPLRGVIQGGKKLIDLPLPELYDLGADPGETENLVSTDRRAVRELAALLPEESVWPPRAGEIGSEEARRLRSLGYVAGGARGKQRYTAEDDPKRLVELDHMLNRIPQLWSQGRTREAKDLAWELLERRPGMTPAYAYLARLLLEDGEQKAALGVLQEARARQAASPELLRQLALTLVSAGRPGEALEVLAPLAREEPGAETLNVLAVAQAEAGQPVEALTTLERALELDPESARTHENRSFVLLRLGRFEETRAAARRALELDPDLANAWNNLGVALYNLDRPQEAVDAWQRSLALAPGDYDTLFNLGLVAAEAGRVEEARSALNRFIQEAPSPLYDDARKQARAALAGLGPGG